MTEKNMTTAEYKKYSKKWNKFYGDIFKTLENDDIDAAFEHLNKAALDPEFFAAPLVPSDVFQRKASPLNEMLAFLAHDRVFFKKQEPTETILQKVDRTNLTEKQREFIEKLDKAIDLEKEKIAKKKEEDKKDGVETELEGKPINIPGAIPHYKVEKLTAIPFIEKLIELGANPKARCGEHEMFYYKVLTLDSVSATKYVINKLSDQELQLTFGAHDALTYCLNQRAEKSFNTILEEKGHLFDLNKNFDLLDGRNYLHFALGAWLPNEAQKLIKDGLTSLTKKSVSGHYPVELIPNTEIATSMEHDKKVIRKNSLAMSEEFQPFIPKDFIPHEAITTTPDTFYEVVFEITQAQINKEKEAKKEALKGFKKAF